MRLDGPPLGIIPSFQSRRSLEAPEHLRISQTSPSSSGWTRFSYLYINITSHNKRQQRPVGDSSLVVFLLAYNTFVIYNSTASKKHTERGRASTYNPTILAFIFSFVISIHDSAVRCNATFSHGSPDGHSLIDLSDLDIISLTTQNIDPNSWFVHNDHQILYQQCLGPCQLGTSSNPTLNSFSLSASR